MGNKRKAYYFLDTDDDGHWYLIEAKHKQEWWDWLERVYHDEGADVEVPAYAQELGHHPNSIEFTDWRDRID